MLTLIRDSENNWHLFSIFRRMLINCPRSYLPRTTNIHHKQVTLEHCQMLRQVNKQAPPWQPCKRYNIPDVPVAAGRYCRTSSIRQKKELSVCVAPHPHTHTYVLGCKRGDFFQEWFCTNQLLLQLLLLPLQLPPPPPPPPLLSLLLTVAITRYYFHHRYYQYSLCNQSWLAGLQAPVKFSYDWVKGIVRTAVREKHGVL